MRDVVVSYVMFEVSCTIANLYVPVCADTMCVLPEDVDEILDVGV